jgi:hypothetical protein
MGYYNWNHVEKIRQQPHLLGHLIGKDAWTPLHSEWIKYIWQPKGHHCLQAHRGSYKTSAITEVGALFWLAFHPDDRIAIVKKTWTSAAESVRNIANIASIPEIAEFLQFTWGEKWKFVIKKEGKIEFSCKKTHTKESSIEALSCDSAYTGRHYDFCIFDDVVDINDRLSIAEREHTKIAVQEIRTSVLDPRKPMGFIGTPWERSDAWSIMPPAKKYPVSATGLLTEQDVLDKKATTTKLLYSINYDLEFQAEANMLFSNPFVGDWHWDSVYNVKAHVDAAYDGNHFCALTIMGKLPSGKVNAVGWVFPGNVKNWMSFIARKVTDYKAQMLFMENNADRGYSLDVIRLHPEIKQNHIWCDDYREDTQKYIKIATYLGELWSDIEWAKETETAYLEQCVDFMENSEPDDAPDSASSLIRQGGYSTTRSFDTFFKAWQM